MTKRIAGAIIRVSTARQLERTSPEKQLEAIQVLAGEQGFELAAAHIWRIAESGARRQRLSFQIAHRAAAAGEISRVYVYSVDRLGRDLLEMLMFLRDLEDLQVECWEAERRRRLRWDGFTTQIEGVIASRERREILKRTQDGLLRRVKEGKFPGGRIPLGYSLNRETGLLEINEEEAPLVRMIFEWTVEERLSAIKIAERLTAMGIPTHTQRRKIIPGPSQWRGGMVLNILGNTTYKGEWVYGKKSKRMRPEDRISASFPAIVTPETFQLAKAVRRSNRLMDPKSNRHKYLLSGSIRCGNCGLSYSGTAWGKKARRYYLCNGRGQWRKLGRDKCFGRSIKAEPLEAVIWEEIKAFILDPDIVINQLRELRLPDDELLAEQLAEAEERIRELKRRERNALRMAVESAELDVKILDDQLREIHFSLETVERFRDDLLQSHARGEQLEKELFGVAERLATLRERVDQATFEDKRRAVVELVKGIEIATEEIDGKNTAIVTITYRFDQVPGVQQGRGTLVVHETLERTRPQRAFNSYVAQPGRSTRSR